MTEKNDTTETTEDTTEVQEQAQEPTGAAQKPQEGQEQPEATGNQEAAKYRRRLRETEAERDALTARLEAMQKAEVERLAEHHIARGSGLWAAFELADMLDEDGNVDPAKVATAAKSAQEQLGLSESRHGGRAPLAGRTPALDAGPSRFEAAFGPGE